MTNVILERIAFICAGNHNRSGEVRKRIIQVIELLQEHQSLSLRDLAEHLDCDISSNAGKARFYSSISPLRGKNPLKVRFLGSERDPITGQIYYELCPRSFRANWSNLKSAIIGKLTTK